LLVRLFFQGTSTLNQIEKVLELIGKPKPDDIESIESPHAATILSSISVTKKRSFQNFFPNASEAALDLLRRLLVFNPNNRLTIEEALRHKYVEQFSSPEEEIICENVIEIPMDDNIKFTVKEYRDAIYADISKKKKEQRKRMQEKYLSQLGITPEMIEQQKLAQQQQLQQQQQQIQSQSQQMSEASSPGIQNGKNSYTTSATTSNYTKASAPKDDGRYRATAYEKKPTYTSTKTDGFYNQTETQKPPSRGGSKQPTSTTSSNYASNNISSNLTGSGLMQSSTMSGSTATSANKTSSNFNNYYNHPTYTAEVKTTGQSSMMGSNYGKLGTSTGSAGLKKKTQLR